MLPYVSRFVDGLEALELLQAVRPDRTRSARARARSTDWRGCSVTIGKGLMITYPTIAATCGADRRVTPPAGVRAGAGAGARARASPNHGRRARRAAAARGRKPKGRTQGPATVKAFLEMHFECAATHAWKAHRSSAQAVTGRTSFDDQLKSIVGIMGRLPQP